MKKYLLSSEELERIYMKVSEARCPAADRLRLLCIYWAGKGKEVNWIRDFLFLPSRTIYHYLEEYYSKKKTSNDESNSSGSPTKLSEEEEKELKDHLEKNIYESTIVVIDHIRERYGVSFSRGGLAKWLHRNNFRYKRPKRVPYTVDVEKQEAFIKLYKEMKEKKQEDEVILFIDGVHPDHQTQNVHGWIKRSQLAQVPSTGKQKRLHYMGAVEIQNDRVDHKMKEYKKIDSESVKDFLMELKNHYPGKKLKIICDRGAYHTSKTTRKFVEENKEIELIYLPPRCPNLNLIERLWKIMRENVTYNKYYKHFADFASAIRYFFTEKILTMQHILTTRLKDNFHVIHPLFLQTLS